MLARAAQFQAAWFFGLVILVILGLTLVAAGFVLRGAMRMWRAGDHGPAAIVGGATLLSVAAFLGMYATAFGGLIVSGGST